MVQDGTAASWRNFADLRQTFNSADAVGDCVGFNIGGNKYRLVARVRYATGSLPGVVYVLKVLTHAEYDENKWPDQCGCYDPPPKKKKKKRRTPGLRPIRKPKDRSK